jgi:PAS domain S-box-containing protein
VAFWRRRKRAEQAQAYLAAIVESSDDAILSKNLDGIIQSCNAAAERIFGYSARELVGRPISILIPPERRDEESRILDRLRRGERVDHYETVRVAKDGRAIEVSLTISPIRGPSGSIVGALKVARDITDRKRAALALDQGKDDLLAVLSHELRTPLNAIVGWSHLLHEASASSETVKRAAETIHRNAQIQARLISDAVDSSRIAAGKKRLDVQPVAGVARAVTATAASERPAQLEPPVWLDTAPWLGGVRVLVVDDHEDARQVVKAVLERCGATVAVAASASEALSIVPGERPDVLLSDVEMPEQSGYDLLRRLRSLPPERGGQTPAVALTGHATAHDRVKLLRAGFQMHVPKPVQPAELATVVASLARKHG